MPTIPEYANTPQRCANVTQNPAGTTTTAQMALDAHWKIDFGATGAVAATSRQLRGMTITRSAAGVYAITGLPSASFAAHYLQAQQALALVKSWQVTAFNAANGTATFTHSVAGTATDPTSGDSVFVHSHFER